MSKLRNDDAQAYLQTQFEKMQKHDRLSHAVPFLMMIKKNALCMHFIRQQVTEVISEAIWPVDCFNFRKLT